MVLLAEYPDVTETDSRNAANFRPLFDHNKRLALILHDDSSYHDEWKQLENIHESVCAAKGQFISLNILDFGEATLPGILCSALEYSQTARSFRINLPMILQNNPHTESPFINRAILWQRLCDRIIEDENNRCPAVLVIENIDLATPKTQHDAARLIRFHITHRIHRTFLLTLNRNNLSSLKPELCELITDQL